MKIEEVKRNLNKRVKYNNNRDGSSADYIFTGCIFRRGKDGFFYQAELQDLKQCRSILICKLEDVQPLEEEKADHESKV